MFSIFYLPSGDVPKQKERLGTMLWQANFEPQSRIVEENLYCYYPKSSAESRLIIKKAELDGCTKWFGQVLIKENPIKKLEQTWWEENKSTNKVAITAN